MGGPEPSVVVIGAGPAGLAAAARLCELDLLPTVVEATTRVGGMAGSLQLWGHTVDLGPHRFFSADPVVLAFWHRYMRGDHVMVQRQTRIYYRGRFFDYPLKSGNALRNLGLGRSIVAVGSYATARLAPERPDGSLESWVSHRFGKALFETFFKTYTEKLWGISCKDLDADWAAQRIQGLTLWAAVKSALTGNRGKEHKTLVDEFAYPATGNQSFYDRLRHHIEMSTGEDLRLGIPVQKVQVSDGHVTGVVLADGEQLAADWVVSSMPITLLLKALPDVPRQVQDAAERLRFRHTILVYLLVSRIDLFPDQWLYIHDPAVLHGRITNFRNWSPDIIGDDDHSVVCMEFWCFDEDPIWGESEESLVRRATEEAAAVGLIPTDTVVGGRMIRIPRCYPVYERGYAEPLKTVTDYLDGIHGLVPIGRYGAFKYNNQDHSLLMGIMAAEAVAAGRMPSLWHVNTDTVYQEQAPSDSLSGGEA